MLTVCLFASRPILKDISFTVEPGQTLALVSLQAWMATIMILDVMMTCQLDGDNSDDIHGDANDRNRE